MSTVQTLEHRRWKLKTPEDGETSYAYELQDQYCGNVRSQIQCNPHQNFNTVLFRNFKKKT